MRSYLAPILVASLLVPACRCAETPATRSGEVRGEDRGGTGGATESPRRTEPRVQGTDDRVVASPRDQLESSPPPPRPGMPGPRVGEGPHRRPTEPDPTGGTFTLEDATEGLAGSGPLVAEIETDLGRLRCRLYADQAPTTVANFVGLARGRRPFWDTHQGAWVTRPFYDGVIFHRVIPGFMVQGGDPAGRGTGGPGYRFDDEIVPGLVHDRAGILSMANAGPGTNGSQFFVLDGAAPHLNGRHTVFGECSPASAVARIARVPQGPGNRPLTDVVMRSVRIGRGDD